MPDGLVSTVLVGLVNDQDVSDFEQSGLDGLNVVAHTGCADYHADVGELSDLDLRLSGADGLQDDQLTAIDRRSNMLNPKERRRDGTRRLLVGRAGDLLREHLLRHDSERLDAVCDAFENGERSLEQSARDLLKLEYP